MARRLIEFVSGEKCFKEALLAHLSFFSSLLAEFFKGLVLYLIHFSFCFDNGELFC